MAKPFIILFVFLFLAPLFIHADAQSRGPSEEEERSTSSSITKPSGELETTSASDIKPMNRGSSTFNEAWVYHIYLDDGTQLYLSYMLANFGTFMSPVGGGRLSVINFDGEYYQVARQYDIDQMKYSEQDYKLRLHPEREIWFEGKLPENHRVRYKTEKDGVAYDIDLTFDEIHAGYRWGDGFFEADGEEIGIQMHIPQAKVSGKVKINDESKQVTGTAYMDHTYQSTITPRVLSSGYRYINHDTENWQIGYFLLPKETREHTDIVGYSLKKQPDGVKLKKPSTIRLSDNTDFKGGRVPENLSVDFNPSGSSSVTVKEGFERLSFLSEVSGLRKRIARRYLGGEIIEYRGVGQLDDGNRAYLNYFQVE